MVKQLTMPFWTDEPEEVRTYKQELLWRKERMILWGGWVKKILPYYDK